MLYDSLTPSNKLASRPMMKEVTLEKAVDEILIATRENTKGNPRDYPFFLIFGAGVSHPSIPLADGIIDCCRDRLKQLSQNLPVETPNPLEGYQNYFQAAYPHRESRQKFLSQLIRGRPVTAATFRLAHLLGAGKLTNLVFTTNFDELLSRALRLLGFEEFVVCDHPKTTQRINLNAPHLQLIHVHGIHWFYDCCNLKEEIAGRSAASSDSESMRNRLDEVLRVRSPIVIGYSGWPDDVIMKALHARVSGRDLPYNLYWFCFKRSDVRNLPDWLTGHPDVRFVLPAIAQPAPYAVAGAEASAASRKSSPLVTSPAGELSPEPRLPALRVFDAMISKLDLNPPTLTSDPLGFFAEQLEKNLNLKEVVTGDPYALRDVLRRVRAAVTWVQSQTDTLEQVRNALRRAAHSEAMAAAEKVDLALLNAKEAEDFEAILHGVYLAVADSDPASGCRACEIRIVLGQGLLEASESAGEWDWHTRMAMAFTGKGYCLNRLADSVLDPARALQLTDEAIAAYRKAAEVFPAYADAWYNLGLSLGMKAEKEGDRDIGERLRDEEIAAYRKAIEIDPDHSVAWNNLGLSLGLKAEKTSDVVLSERLRNEEVAAYQRAIEAAPQHATAWYNLGISLGLKAEKEPDRELSRRLREDELAAYRQAVASDSTYSAAWNNLGLGLGLQAEKETDPELSRQFYEEEIAAYRSAVAADPESVAARINLGISLVQKADRESSAEPARKWIDEAIAACRAASDIDPDDPLAWNGLGFSLVKGAHLAVDPEQARALCGEAIAACLRALEINPDYARAWLNLGRAREELADRESVAGQAGALRQEALEAYRRCVRVDPSLSTAWYRVGSLLGRQLNQETSPARRRELRAEQITAFQKGLEGDPRSDVRRDLDEALLEMEREERADSDEMSMARR